MHFQLQALVLGALALEGALAQPALRHHARAHEKRHALQKRVDFHNKALYKDIPDSVWQSVDWSHVDYSGGAGGSGSGSGSDSGSSGDASAASSGDAPASATASPASTAAAAASPASESPAASTPSSSGGDSSHSSSSPSTGSCSNLADVYTSGDTSSQGPTAATAHSKRALLQQDLYVGNTGGSSYGSNLKPIADCRTEGKHYSLTFVNNMGSDQTFWLWNKIGQDGAMDGMMKNAYFQFKLAAGQRGSVEVSPNSQLAFSLAAGRASTNGNVPNTNIGEANFGDQDVQWGATGGSFFDVSMVTYHDINNHGGKAQYVKMKISSPGYSDSTNDNCVYNVGSDNAPVNPGADGKCYLGPNDSATPFHVTVTFG